MTDASHIEQLTAGSVPAIRGDHLRRTLDDEAIVWSARRGEPTALDPVATVMLDVIDGEASISELAEDVSAAVGVAPEVALAQVTRTVQLFDHLGLLRTEDDWGKDPVTAIAQRELFDGPLSH